MKRPLVPVALLYSCGLLLAAALRLPFWIPLSLGLLLAGLTLVARRPRPWCLAALLVAAGWANLSWRTAVISPDDLRVLLGDTPRLVTVQGRLLETPSDRIYVRDEKEFWRSLARVEITRLKEEGQTWQPAVGHVVVSTRGAMPAGF